MKIKVRCTEHANRKSQKASKQAFNSDPLISRPTSTWLVPPTVLLRVANEEPRKQLTSARNVPLGSSPVQPHRDKYPDDTDDFTRTTSALTD